jgi:hypothetical protein
MVNVCSIVASPKNPGAALSGTGGTRSDTRSQIFTLDTVA